MKKIYLLFILLITNLLMAQDGSIDNTFNPNDIGFGSGDGANGSVYSLAELPDGKKIITGNFNVFNGFYSPGLVRLNHDGSVDQTFYIGSGANSTIYTCQIQPDGKIIIGGNFTSFNDIPVHGIIRLNADGSTDSTFNANLNNSSPSTIKIIKLLNDGKMYIGGDFSIYNIFTGNSLNGIARLNNDGTLDTTFYHPSIGTISNSVDTLSVQNDGKLIIGGGFTIISTGMSENINYLARLNPDRSLDTTFNVPNFVISGDVKCIAIQQDGKILIGGSFGIDVNGSVSNYIARLNSNGNPDDSFISSFPSNQSGVLIPKVNDLNLQSDGKIIVFGNFSNYGNTEVNDLIRLNNDSTIDTSFSTNITSTTSLLTGFITNDNKIIVGSENTIKKDQIYIGGIVQLEANGLFDGEFNKQTGFNQKVNIINTQLENKILVGGEFNAYNGVSQRLLSKLNNDGSLDENFNINGIGPDSAINDLKIHTNNKILVAGQFNNFNGTTSRKIIRLHSDGAIDTEFNIGTGFEGVMITNLAIQSDSKIIASGLFNSFNGYNSKNIARLNPDGSFDNSFTVGTGANNTINKSVIQSDGRIIAVGNFTSFNGVNSNRIIRLNADGSIDNTFNVGIGSNSSILDIELQNDNKIIIAGFFTSYNGIGVNKIARLNSDGSLDTTFNGGAGANQTIITLEILSDGKILVGGFFNSYDNVIARGIAKLNIDGSLDTTFNSGSGFRPSVNIASLVNTIAIDQNGKILVGGGFKSYADQGKNRIVRINNSNTLSIDDTLETKNDLLVKSIEEIISVTNFKNVIKEISIFDLTGKRLWNKENIYQNSIEISNIPQRNTLLLVYIKDEKDNTKTVKLFH